jgi:hypothetical protein
MLPTITRKGGIMSYYNRTGSLVKLFVIDVITQNLIKLR